MTNSIKLCPISSLLGKKFFIPSYQRGYRWTNQQVEDLLNDIYIFADNKNKKEKEFYCLQPIVVKKCNQETIKKINSPENFSENNTDENNVWYEVVDGQQRLTTIRILIIFLIKNHLKGESLEQGYGKKEFIIDYETRRNIREFLNNITDLKNIGDSKKNIDFYFISRAYICISEWFASKPLQRDARESVLRTLVHDMENKKEEGIVQIIWYEIGDEINPIATFLRINMGKIPLTNAELIKALFLQKSNFVDSETAQLKQIEIANEWDSIEYTLQDNDFWWFINKTKNTVPARIEFLFDLMFKIEEDNVKIDKKLKEFQKTFGTDKYATFRFFNHKFSNDFSLKHVTKEWNKAQDYFLAFEEWFNDPVWFHYIGFLIYCEISIVDIYKLYKERNKDEFTKSLKAIIKNKIFNEVECEKIKQDDGSFQYSIDLPFSNKNKQKIRELLLLLNIQFIVRQYGKSNDEMFFKFPFKLFKEESWDVEHVDSFTDNPIRDKNTQIEWLQTASQDLKELPEELKDEIQVFINTKDNAKEFKDLQPKIIKEAKESPNDDDLKNSIGNLTLLDAGTNRGYGNALFPTKRRIIIERDMQGKFIPICTKNVFLKYFDKKGTSRARWAEEDISNYENFIGEILNDFLTVKAL